MAVFSRVKVKDQTLPQLFVGFHEEGFGSSLVMDDIIIDNTAALVGTSLNRHYVLKLIEPRKWHEIVKLLWGRSRVNKEVNGNKLLQSLSIKAPDVVAYGVGIIPSRNYRYIGYILMENLSDKGATDASHLLFWDNKLTKDIRRQVYNNIASDLKKMRENHLVFSDLTLGNIMAYPDGAVAWIDTGVTQYGSNESERFNKKFNYSISRFIDIHKNVLNKEEYLLFDSLFV